MTARSTEILDDDLLSQVGLDIVTLAAGTWPWESKGAAFSIAADTEAFRGGARQAEIEQYADQIWGVLRAGLLARAPMTDPSVSPEEFADRRLYGRPPATAEDEQGMLDGGRMFRQTARLKGFSNEAGALRLAIQPTWYYYFLGSNGRVSPRSRAFGPVPEWMIQAETADVTALSESALANLVSINLAIVAGIGDSRMLLIQRPKPRADRPGESSQISAAGFLDWADFLPDPSAGPWRGALREALEETSLPVSSPSVVLLALCRENAAFSTGIAALCRLDEASAQLDPRRADDDEEFELEWWPWEPEAIAIRLRAEGGWARFNAMGASALVYALASDFGRARVVAAWSAHR